MIPDDPKTIGEIAAGYHSRPMTPEWAAELIREERRKDAEAERQAVRDHFWSVVRSVERQHEQKNGRVNGLIEGGTYGQ